MPCRWSFIAQKSLLARLVLSALALVPSASAAWLSLAGVSTVVVAQSDDAADDEEYVEFLPGLIGAYRAASGESAERVDESLSFRWQDASPDPRLPPGPFRATWTGVLQVLAPGEYQFGFRAAGSVRLLLNGEQVLQTSSPQASWAESPPVALEFGEQQVVVEYERKNESGELAWYWSGPQFAWEPILPRWLGHLPADEPDESYRRGAELVRQARCSGCHQLPVESTSSPGPALDRLAGQLHRAWLVDRLMSIGPGEAPAEPAEQSARSMPYLAMPPADAQAIADYLLPPAASNETPLEPTVGDIALGRELFHTTGCLACHRLGELGSPKPQGGNLTAVADKRPASFFAAWLVNPAALNAAHRMPVFPLSAEERGHLAAFLAEQHSTKAVDREATDAAGSAAARGAELVVRYRCGSCHTLPGQPTKPPRRKIDLAALRQSSQPSGCLGAPRAAQAQPGFEFSSRVTEDVVEFLGQSQPGGGAESASDLGLRVIAEHNCLACHLRGASAGLAPTALAVAEEFPELAPEVAYLVPPSLESVGDKLTEQALAEAIELRRPPLRPWLRVRMPKFELNPEELQAAIAALVLADRLPEEVAPQLLTRVDAENPALHAAGPRLVTSDGFGCASCHQIGTTIPEKVQPAARGTDLSLVGQRLRPQWFERWVRNPARIVPRMEMPSIQQPIRGVLDAHLDSQLAAVWYVLNLPGFSPPLPNPVRTLRARNDPLAEEPALVVLDMLQTPDRALLRPFAAGLANRHSMAFDFEQGGLAAWWVGDFARQRAPGKSWVWEIGGTQLMPVQSGPDLALVAPSGQVLAPIFDGQRVFVLDSWEPTPSGVRFNGRLRFETLPGERDRTQTSDQIVLQVMQEVSALWSGGTEPAAVRGGWRRTIEVSGVPRGWQLRISPWGAPLQTTEDASSPSTGAMEQPSTQMIRWSELPARPSVVLTAPPASAWHCEANRASTQLAADREGRIHCELVYTCEIDPDAFTVDTPPPVALPALELPLVPGFKAVQWPLPISEMPTGLAWLPDGSLAFTSLKGGVFLTKDTDEDSLPDALQLLCDGLPAPYGLATVNNALDVSTKFGLVRLADLDGDGEFESRTLVADDWGYSPDYHDWAIGPVPDGAGGYFLALPCQQDDRTSPAAQYRGHILQLSPRTPTDDNPRLFEAASYAAGLRFPMGLVRMRDGTLLATDNQGNYNPFNELNEILPGERYGFVNRLEALAGLRGGGRDPAVNLPHPWTRSVNGLCVLESPSDGPNPFGPFAGHLIGCEYDTRALVRISLQRTEGLLQGAAYPFTLPAEEGQPALEGPLVCGVSPTGELVVGSIRDSGWGGGQNTGSFVSLRLLDDWPAGLAEMTATARGFRLRFTRPVDATVAGSPESYGLAAYRRASTPDYGGPDLDRHDVPVLEVRLSGDRLAADLELGELRTGFVYELHLRPLGSAGEPFFPAEAHFTLHRVPAGE